MAKDPDNDQSQFFIRILTSHVKFPEAIALKCARFREMICNSFMLKVVFFTPALFSNRIDRLHRMALRNKAGRRIPLRSSVRKTLHACL
jgi:hypothetical protein